MRTTDRFLVPKMNASFGHATFMINWLILEFGASKLNYNYLNNFLIYLIILIILIEIFQN